MNIDNNNNNNNTHPSKYHNQKQMTDVFIDLKKRKKEINVFDTLIYIWTLATKQTKYR